MDTDAKRDGSLGPIIGTIIVLVAIILGGIYFWHEHANEGADDTAGTAAVNTSVDSIGTQSSSDDTGSIEADLGNTDTTNIGADLGSM